MSDMGAFIKGQLVNDIRFCIDDVAKADGEIVLRPLPLQPGKLSIDGYVHWDIMFNSDSGWTAIPNEYSIEYGDGPCCRTKPVALLPMPGPLRLRLGSCEPTMNCTKN